MTRGFLVVDKPAGITSNQVVGQVKKATGVKKVGHAGTLDPMATGALVMAVGNVTRLIKYIQDQPKEYRATAVFGVATDTLDAEGAVLTREPMDVSAGEVEALVSRFTGTIAQIPPMVSALKRDGRRLYELAREGQVVEREARSVEIHELEILTVGTPPYPEVEFRVVCGKGTYIRSLAHDMAAALGGSAHLTALRRIRIGSLRASHGVTIEDMHNWEAYLMTPAQALANLKTVAVDEETARGVRNGVRFVGGPLLEGPRDDVYAVVDPQGDLIAIYQIEGECARPDVVLPS
ncbi:MAG TPA: tRNA pseudouridine(55) synthase TruB [Acidimicrobiia bacterium]|nr:tRNA pseudouridine(55) synthase TruB [Acidimicrobiia bacterium]